MAAKREQAPLAWTVWHVQPRQHVFRKQKKLDQPRKAIRAQHSSAPTTNTRARGPRYAPLHAPCPVVPVCLIKPLCHILLSVLFQPPPSMLWHIRLPPPPRQHHHPIFCLRRFFTPPNPFSHDDRTIAMTTTCHLHHSFASFEHRRTASKCERPYKRY